MDAEIGAVRKVIEILNEGENTIMVRFEVACWSREIFGRLVARRVCVYSYGLFPGDILCMTEFLNIDHLLSQYYT